MGWTAWKVTYDDETTEEFYDISLELLASYVNEDKNIVMIERTVYKDD